MYMNNPMHSRSEDYDPVSGDRGHEDTDSLSISLSGRGKKERKRQDLPPLGKIFVPIAPQVSLGGAGSSAGTGPGAGLGPVHPTTLAPLVVNGAGSGSVPSNGNSPTGREFGSFLGNTTSPMSNPGPMALARDGALIEEWARRDSPAPLGTEEAPVRCRDEGAPLRSLHPHLEDIRNIAYRFSNHSTVSEDKLDREREGVTRDLKELLFSDGHERRQIAPSRRSTGSIVTGHSLLQSSSSQREPLTTSADILESATTTLSTASASFSACASALSGGHHTGDERQSISALSSSHAPQTALSASHLFKMDLSDSGVSFDPASMKIQGPSGSSKHAVKPIRPNR